MKKNILLLVLFLSLISFIPKTKASTDTAYSYVLMDLDSGRVLKSKNKDTPLLIASITKIMTAIIAIENKDINDIVTVDESVKKSYGSGIYISIGEEITLKDLLYGLMLRSGNDAAIMISTYISGSEESFVKLMNQKAKEIGMKNTHFVTPSGLDDDEHYSTAYDMALLGRYAVNNPVIRSVCSKSKATLSYGNPPYRRTLYNHNRLLNSYKYALGIKTGFTKKSGRCLVSYAERNGVGLVAVTLNAPGDWSDHRQMLDYGFSVLNSRCVEADIPDTISVVGGNVENLSIKCNSFDYFSLQNKTVTQELYLDRFVYAPIKKGDKIGEVRYYFDGEYIGSSYISADADVKAVEQKQKEKSFFRKIKERFFND